MACAVPLSVEEEEALQIAALEFLSDYGYLERVEKQCNIYRSSEMVKHTILTPLTCSQASLSTVLEQSCCLQVHHGGRPVPAPTG